MSIWPAHNFFTQCWSKAVQLVSNTSTVSPWPSLCMSLWHLKATKNMVQLCAMPAMRSKLNSNCHLHSIPLQWISWQLVSTQPLSWSPSTQLQHGAGRWPQTVRPICVPNGCFGGWIKAARLRPTPQMEGNGDPTTGQPGTCINQTWLAGKCPN